MPTLLQLLTAAYSFEQDIIKKITKNLRIASMTQYKIGKENFSPKDHGIFSSHLFHSSPCSYRYGV
jgi:hypothetical protein